MVTIEEINYHIFGLPEYVTSERKPIMLIIRSEQIAVFQQESIRKFEDCLLTHIKEVFPGYYGEVGSAKVKELIGLAIKRASRYKLETEHDIVLFVNLMLSLGTHFDEDSQFPWVSEILNDEFIPDPGDRMDILYERVLQYIGETETA